ncbi:TonB-dependent siderophore receptor [Methylobacterium sp. J-070]|uniref:TonB-dependent siderophore receptor n=1 Tax=Methylobacterium sp. J-070 TaxID=2836650 RepID=UPI001FB87698|nr:TonB-dependent receptor [Methylobacterium sp. J-070]MCJ2054201.1 TonB-dependent receptor [Methylobacterium sp. J-070]
MVRAEDGAVDFAIASGALGDVLTQIGTASGSPISFPPQAVQGLKAGPIRGRMSKTDAVARAIAGTPLRMSVGANGMVMVTARPAPAASGGAATDIADIDVTGNGINANGSSDPLATEGSASYAATGANVASKTALSLKETPQSVSVITHQQLQDQKITTLDQAVDAAPGLIRETGGGAGQSNLSSAYYARGFQINSLSVDGGTPILVGGLGEAFNSNYIPVIDLSQYDSVQILRGSGGQYSGTGSPSGTVSLQRKRPVDRMTGTIDQSFDSNGGRRTVGDLNTGPLLEGLVSIRGSFVHDDAENFYRISNKAVNQGYLNAEIHPAEGTQINLGGTHNETNAVPWFNGLPTYQSGRFVPFSRSTCLCAPWSKTDIVTDEYFAQLRQDIVEGWQFNVNASMNFQASKNDNLTINAFDSHGLLANNTGARWFATYNERKSDQYLLDSFITGEDEFLGMPIETTFGTSLQYIDQSLTKEPLSYSYPNATRVNVLTFTGHEFPRMPLTRYTKVSQYDKAYALTQIGGYASIRLSPVPWAHLLIAERISGFQQDIQQYRSGTTVTSNSGDIHIPVPDVGLTLDLDPHMSIYGSYSTTYLITQNLASPGKLLPPTDGHTWEAGIKRSDLDDQLQSSLAFYRAELTNVPFLDPNQPYSQDPNSLLKCCFLAAGRTLSQGIDAAVTGKITPDWDVTANYTFNDNKTYSGDGSQTKASYIFPKHIAKLFTSFRPSTGWTDLDQELRHVRIGFGADFHSTTIHSDTYQVYNRGRIQSYFYQVRQPSYATFSAFAKYDINETASVQLNVYNLLDRRYYQSIGNYAGGNWFGQGRTVVGSVHLSF